MVLADSSTNVGNNREISSYLEFSSDDDNAYYTHVKRKREGGGGEGSSFTSFF